MPKQSKKPPTTIAYLFTGAVTLVLSQLRDRFGRIVDIFVFSEAQGV